MAKFYLTVVLVACCACCRCQELTGDTRDSVAVTLRQAEDSFLENNLALVAQRYSIDSAKATVITAKLWDNPEFGYSGAFYNFADHHFFEPEMNVQLSQLVRLAGKRNKAVTLAKSGIDIAQYQFFDLMRTLRYALRNDFYNIFFLEQSSKLYELEITSLKNIIASTQHQVSKGYAAPIEVLRIQSELYTLQAEYDDLQTSIESLQAEMKVLMRSPPGIYIIARADTATLNRNYLSQWNYERLLDTAISNRPDLKALSASIEYNQDNLTLQKALGKPDVTVLASYDRLGSYVKNYNSIGIGIPLPLFNRNQGNIKNAAITLSQSRVDYQSGLDQVKSDVSTGYMNALRAEKLLQSFDPAFEADNRKMIEQVAANYQKKNITLLEFLDFYNSYKQNVLQLNQLRFNKASALEQLNFSTGKLIFN